MEPCTVFSRNVQLTYINGCHLEHFSEKFPGGGPVLRFEGGAAVICGSWWRMRVDAENRTFFATHLDRECWIAAF